jgi:probable addiction module antidote protein
MKDRTHDEAMAEAYREDPAYAVRLLNSILEDGDQGEFLIALRQMAKAFGGVQAIAEQAELNPTQLYRTLSSDGNPALSNFSAILKAMGMRLSVQAVPVSKKPVKLTQRGPFPPTSHQNTQNSNR